MVAKANGTRRTDLSEKLAGIYAIHSCTMSTSGVLPQPVYDLQDAIHYQFDNPRLLLEALRTAGAGYHIANTQNATDGNKRLAQLGDAVLRMLLLDDWYLAGAKRGEFANKVYCARALRADGPRRNCKHTNQQGVVPLLSVSDCRSDPLAVSHFDQSEPMGPTFVS